MIFKKNNIGIALGGGGVRALACLGALKILNRHGIRADCISGTSMGSIIGALFAYYEDADTVEKIIMDTYNSREFKALSEKFVSELESGSRNKNASLGKKFKKYYSQIHLFRKFLRQTYIISQDEVRPVIDRLIPDIDIKFLKIRTGIVCTDLVEGKKVLLTEGSLREAVMGSIAIPGIIEPLERGRQILSDGGTLSFTPVEEARELGAEFVIAVEIMSSLRRREEFKNGMEIYSRSYAITSKELHKRILKKSDIVISPQVRNIYWADFRKISYCIAAGMSAAFGKIEYIRK
ncbi:MAG: patatin-like phospholipase family protein [Elusimicrobia bacterium]|nr:patatin-like phospholipase family protein [Elusimicrobiota bacterium]